MYIRGWRKLQNEGLHNLYYTPSIIRVIKWRKSRWTWYVAHIGDKRNAYRILVRNPEEIKPLGRPRHRWEDSIKMVLRYIEWGDRDCIYLAQDRARWRALVNTVMKLRVPLNFGKFCSCCATGGFSRRTQLRRLVHVRPGHIDCKRQSLTMLTFYIILLSLQIKLFSNKNL
jgi:hypothetical protein